MVVPDSIKKLLAEALNKNQYLKRLELQQIKDMVECMYERTYQQGEYVITQGEPGNHLFVLAGESPPLSSSSPASSPGCSGESPPSVHFLPICKRHVIQSRQSRSSGNVCDEEPQQVIAPLIRGRSLLFQKVKTRRVMLNVQGKAFKLRAHSALLARDF